MSGIYVTKISDSVSEKQLKVYFSNPRHGGGHIQKILYPLPNRTAVIFFADDKVTEEILKKEHQLLGKLDVSSLPKAVASWVIVEVEKDVSNFMSLTPNVVDELQFLGEIQIDFLNNKGMYLLQGSWYQLEWALHYIRTMYEFYNFKPRASKAGRTEETPEILTKSTKPHQQEVLETKDKNGIVDDIHENVSSKANEMEKIQASGYATQAKSDEEEDEDDDANLYTVSVYHRQQMSKPKMTHGIDVYDTDFGDIPMTFTFEVYNHLRVVIEMGDITKQSTDAIVNPTNHDLSNTYGVSWAIQKAVGVKLKLECQQFLQDNGPLTIADVFHTSGGGKLNKNVNFVLHTIGPGWQEKDSECSTHMLVCTYLNCFMYGENQLWLKSLASPLISAGAFGFPLDVCVQALFDALLLFSMNLSSRCHLNEIHLVCFDQESTAASIMIIQSLLDCDVKHAGKDATERYQSRSSAYQFSASYFEQSLAKKNHKENSDTKNAFVTHPTANLHQTSKYPDFDEGSMNVSSLLRKPSPNDRTPSLNDKKPSLNDRKSREALVNVDEALSQEIKVKVFIPKEVVPIRSLPVNKQNNEVVKDNSKTGIYGDDDDDYDGRDRVKGINESAQVIDALKLSDDEVCLENFSDNREDELDVNDKQQAHETVQKEAEIDVAKTQEDILICADDDDSEFIVQKEQDAVDKILSKGNNPASAHQGIDSDDEIYYTRLSKNVSATDTENASNVDIKLAGEVLASVEDSEEKEDLYHVDSMTGHSVSRLTSKDINSLAKKKNSSMENEDWSILPSMNHQHVNEDSLEADNKLNVDHYTENDV